MDSYFNPVLKLRVARRRALAIGAAAVGGSVLLAACGGDDKNDSGGTKSSSGLVAQPTDETKAAKKGGTFKYYRTLDVTHWDRHTLAGTGSGAIESQLFRNQPALLETPKLAFTGDLVDTWEFSPDKLQLTIKLKDTTTHNKPPVNGRKVDSEDIVVSWQRFEKVGIVRGAFANSVDSNAPIVSMTAVDPKTVAIKLAKPLSSIIASLADTVGMYFMPKEADVKYDARTTPIGFGPWQVAEHRPSQGLKFTKNTGHYLADRIFIDERETAVIPEYATALSQFLAGNLHSAALRQEDILAAKKQVPDLQLFAGEPAYQFNHIKFGWNPSLGKGTPFRDKRVRQAFSRAIDRDIFLDKLYNLAKFEKEGLPAAAYWHSSVQANTAGFYSGEDSYWLNPKDKSFGPNAKNYEYNVAEAKKLLAAAGYAAGLDTVFHYPVGGWNIESDCQVFIGFLAEAGIKAEADTSAGFTVDYRPKFADSHGDFTGFSTRPVPQDLLPDPVEIAFTMYVPNKSTNFSGFMADGLSWEAGDPKHTELLTKARQEFDEKKRIELLREFQRNEADSLYLVRWPGTATTFRLFWPAVRNVQVWRNELITGGEPQPMGSLATLWLDPTKKPS
jgi:peptide/nickel transport system substrate-binding protein